MFWNKLPRRAALPHRTRLMNISSSSLFRFTTKFEYLKEIITRGFGFRPCVEEMAVQHSEGDIFGQLGAVAEKFHSMAVCFCDLPLTQSADHREQYGNYAIAMSKKWAMQQGVTPIRYYHPQSPFQADQSARLMLNMLSGVNKEQHGLIGELMQFMREMRNAAPTDAEMNQLPTSVKDLHDAVNEVAKMWMNQFFGAFHFTRIWEGKWTDKATGRETLRRFYDEREWRAVTFDSNQRLAFELSDVRHIIVTSDEERRQLGELMISQADRLKIADNTKVWGIIKIGSEIFDDI